MPRSVGLFNCARNFWGIQSIARDMPRLVERCEVRLTDARDGPELAADLALADVLIARRDYVGRNSLAGTIRLRGIVTGGVGVEKVDVLAATEMGIPVANSAGNTVTVAESALLLMLALAKQLPSWVQAAREGIEPTRTMGGLELLGKTVGIVEYGRIGQRTAELCRAFGMNVLAFDPYVSGPELTALTL